MPPSVPKPPETRFTRFIQKDSSGCWVWKGWKRKGYGRFHFRGRDLNAHRWSYEHHVGPIPAGLEIDHLCRNRACVNPAHLEPVTREENLRRALLHQRSRPRPRRELTHCRNGHPYDGDNTYVNPKRGGKICRICSAAAQKRSRQRRKAA